MKKLCAVFGSVLLGAWVLHGPAGGNALAGEKVLYSFCSQANCADGESPMAGLIAVNGILYGTTSLGGKHGLGTVFSLDPTTGAETVLHSFGAGSDGAQAYAGLIEANGMLYGTTFAGGGTDCSGFDWTGCGTVFSLDPKTGTETVLYAFAGSFDGAQPHASLIDVNGIVYGTTVYGGNGSYGWGTVFSLDLKTGKEKVLYAFKGTGTDGYYPYAGLIEAGGTLYGTTVQSGSAIAGTVFSLDPGTGTETVLHDFCYRCTDGSFPDGGVVAVNGILYGTTESGGTGSYRKGRYGFGTLFSLDLKSGAEAVVHSYCGVENCVDGLHPDAGLIDANGTLYGTTFGSQGRSDHPGGNVFSFDPGTGTVTGLYTFCSRSNCADGLNPQAGVIKVKDKLYGTTYTGGAHGAGVVFVVGIP